MKILMIPSLYKPYSRGGAEIVFNNLLEELKKEHSISILTIAPWNGWRSLFPVVSEEDGIRVYRFYPLNVFSFIHIIGKPAHLRLVWHVIDMFTVHTYWVARSVIKKEMPDVVMTHNIKGIGYTLPWAIRSMGIPHVHTLQDVQLVNPTGLILYGEEKALKNANILVWLYEWANRILFGSPNMIVFSSHYLHDYYTEHHFFKKSKKIINPNPLPAHLTKGVPHIKEKASPIVFGYVGQLERAKGIFMLIETFKKWKPSYDVQLMLIGRGSAEADIRLLIADDPRIHFVGFVPNEKLREPLSTIHYMVIPSLCYENSPVILFESLAMGVPVIVAQIGGAAEMITEKKNGFIFTPGDTASLLAALDCAGAWEEYGALSTAAREKITGCDAVTYSRVLLDELTPFIVHEKKYYRL